MITMFDSFSRPSLCCFIKSISKPNPPSLLYTLGFINSSLSLDPLFNISCTFPSLGTTATVLADSWVLLSSQWVADIWFYNIISPLSLSLMLTFAADFDPLNYVVMQGQYVKWVSPGGPADLNGMLTGDHIIEVDDVNILEMSHHEVRPTIQ